MKIFVAALVWRMARLPYFQSYFVMIVDRRSSILGYARYPRTPQRSSTISHLFGMMESIKST